MPRMQLNSNSTLHHLLCQCTNHKFGYLLVRFEAGRLSSRHNTLSSPWLIASCPWAGRPAVRCPAAGEGLRGRLRRSAGKLTPTDYVYGLSLRYCWQRTEFRTNQRHICGWQLGSYNVILGLFFLLARIRISGQKSARTRDQWLSPTFCLLNSAPS